ncbi:CYTH domain-containing protein [Streptomyces sp. S3(2020)]|uniref:CYTH domain-containing protein n=1 Tax=Streptomyces sp. S3(2020) TaxID=2732044 RepID=UPI0014895C08|nr:CYTH domain-containing protein [Streptomyces sp. S3(2020)]NNN29655.1 CYTH domain-containing protein [Streptomyces sp. S3(2020)]
MGKEIERKFLVRSADWRAQVTRTTVLCQGYLSTDPLREVRVRVVDDTKAFLTVKAKRPGPERAEFEYPIPVPDARELLAHRTGRLVEKRRHHLATSALGEWVVDEYTGACAGLVVLEIEWADVEDTSLVLPPWVGEDVTGDRRYSNAALATEAGDESTAS